MTYPIIPGQLWIVDDYFSADRFRKIKESYRKTRTPLSMQYDDRILSSWSDRPELQEIVREECDRISNITKQQLAPQVAYVSIDLSGSSIMMHRLHPDIFVQTQIVMSDSPDVRMEFAFSINGDVNLNSELDYQPKHRLTRHDVALAPYVPNTASIYVNEPRGFVGMLGCVPSNSIREVLVLSYTRLY